MNNICIKKSKLKLLFLIICVIISTILFTRYLIINSYQSRAENKNQLIEIRLNSKNYLSKINLLQREGSYKLIFAPGIYYLPGSNTINIPAITSSEEFIDVPVKGGLLLEYFNEIIIDAEQPKNRPKFIVSNEFGVYFKNINKVTISNVNFYGGMPPQKKPSNILPNDPFRSQLLFRNVKTINVNSFFLEGKGLPDNYETMSSAGMRGITILNDFTEGIAYIYNGISKNIPWDNFLIMGNTTALIYDLNLTRYSKIIYDKIANYPFSLLAGTAITGFKGAYINVKRIKIEGFMKVIFIDSSRGATIEEINLTIPPDYNENTQYSGMWIISVNKTPNSKIRGNLYVKNLSLYPKELKKGWENLVIAYDKWFIGLNLLKNVEIRNIKLGLLYKPGDPKLIDNIFPLLSFPKQNYINCLTKSTYKMIDWELMLILRWERGGLWRKINYSQDQFKGCGIEVSQPILHKVILPAYPKGNPNQFLSDPDLMNKWIIENNWPW